MVPTVQWKENSVVILDQNLLPEKEEFLTCHSFTEVAEAIRSLSVRGAPAIGVTAAMGIALGSKEYRGDDAGQFRQHMEHVCDTLAGTRPTAVNLFWAVKRMKGVMLDFASSPVSEIQGRLYTEAIKVLEEDLRVNHAIGQHGQEVIREGDHVLTHCNAGALATAGYGTALGVIRAAWDAGKHIQVFADETRPVLQGARLTAWELQQDGIPVTLITDNMAGALMKNKQIQCCVVGADRIAANGDVANKIGTYSVAVLAKAHGIPFYVAAPVSTIDMDTPDGDQIPIEERNPREVTQLHGSRCIAPEGVKVWNPAFDVTPARLIDGIITEKGILLPGELRHRFSK